MSSRLLIKRIPFEKLEPGLAASLEGSIDDWGGTVFHEPLFNSIASQALGSRLSYLLAYRAGELIACCACHAFPNGLITNTYTYPPSAEIPYGGWVFKPNRTTIRELIENTPVRLLEALRFNSSIEMEPGAQSDTRIKCQTELKTLLVSLAGRTAESLFESMISKQRNKIRRAEKLGIKIELLVPESFDVFKNLSQDLKARTGLVSRNESFIREVFESYYHKGKAACITARLDGEHISSMILLANKSFTIAWVAGRKSELPNNLYQNELLFWESIKWAFGRQSAYFDMCGLDETRYPQLARLKLSFSEDVHKFYSYSLHKLGFSVINKLQRMLRGNK